MTITIPLDDVVLEVELESLSPTVWYLELDLTGNATGRYLATVYALRNGKEYESKKGFTYGSEVSLQGKSPHFATFEDPLALMASIVFEDSSQALGAVDLVIEKDGVEIAKCIQRVLRHHFAGF